MAIQLPAIPPILKPIQHFLKVAAEHERRDPVVTYWCRLYALQTGLGISKAAESSAVLLPLMDWLESTKKSSAGVEAITNDVVAQAHVENYANRLFLWADKEDREARFNKNVVKAFYTSGVILDVCETFGELSVEVQEQRKYAKWKAAYIHNCLKRGEQPLPGPVGGDQNEDLAAKDDAASDPTQPAPHASQPPNVIGFQPPPAPTQPYQPPPAAAQPYQPYQPPPAAAQPYQPPPAAAQPYQPPPAAVQPYQPPPAAVQPPAPAVAGSSAVPLSFDQIAKAQKYSKLAYSALNYEDVPTAIANLQKALHMLQTGQDS